MKYVYALVLDLVGVVILALVALWLNTRLELLLSGAAFGLICMHLVEHEGEKWHKK